MEKSTSGVTERQNMSVPTEEVQQVEAPKEPNFKDQMHKMYYDLIVDLVGKRNGLVNRSNAASGDRVSLTESIRENDQSPEIVAAREAWSQAYLDLMALVEPKVEEIISSSQGSQDEIDEQIKDIDGSLKPAKTLYRKMYGDDEASLLPKEERIKGAVVRSGTGVRRIRGFSLDVTIDGETKNFDNFASTAKYLGWDTPDLQKAFFDKAGTTEQKNLPAEVKFTVSFTETDGDNNTIEKDAFVRAYKDAEDDSNNTASDAADDADDDANGVTDEDDLEGLV